MVSDINVAAPRLCAPSLPAPKSSALLSGPAQGCCAGRRQQPSAHIGGFWAQLSTEGCALGSLCVWVPLHLGPQCLGAIQC